MSADIDAQEPGDRRMDAPPARIGDAVVLLFTRIDERHQRTGRTRHLTLAGEIAPAAGLAICKHDDEEGYYLFGCDSVWESVTDTWHATLDEAKQQAEHEYHGVSLTWRRPA